MSKVESSYFCQLKFAPVCGSCLLLVCFLLFLEHVTDDDNWNWTIVCFCSMDTEEGKLDSELEKKLFQIYKSFLTR